ncbi:uncharacterized protein DDB_G0287625 [Leptopilina heterotoma]|uniref:uncharacterized protein DDB_G0287625 n=1 Tax=Leptopilina heterotoma TaxID=63436 RepID=UPI001CA80D81|nr:uncharacterized protein DDB_G0287625 [Leptopilina heterotoma]XP_043463056.1 uncharacterized protein DDB_G0287625 [Leptopilina heterotoma]
METEELTRLVDGIYKNILEKFNPGARQLINAGKAYLKALHGAAAASRVYVDALSRLARQAQLGTWGGSQDVGSALMRIVEVYKEIQEQEMNILKAFYVDLLVPLETNLEKDTKVVQSEQKKFLQQHKTRSETYSKAAATMKKQRKKSRGASKSGLAMDKELKNMQILEEEKSKLDAFCEQSLKNAMTQERRRYGFVLERQCSLAKHYASFHEVALAALHPSVDEWREVAATREYLPQSVEDMFASRLRQVSFWPDDEENGGSELTMNSQLRKTRSMDSSCLELRLGPSPGNSTLVHQSGPPHLPPALSRARSEANLHASSLSLGPEVPETPPRPRSMAPASRNSAVVMSTGVVAGGWGDAPLARALFAYLSSGENQLSFLEGDLIALMGDRQKGWQFGENLRTQSSGWFPLAYTEVIIDENLGSPNHSSNNGRTPEPRTVPPCKPPPTRPPMPSNDDLSLNHGTNSNGNTNNGTPTNVPKSNSAHNITTPTARQQKVIRPSGTLPTVLAGGRRVQPPVPPVPPPQAVTSLHSSNDSGFSNEPPVQPDIDYSDDEAMRLRRRKPREADRSKKQKQQQQQQPQRDEKPSSGKNWENDSWKSIPRDEKSWHLYRAAMDIWANSNIQDSEKAESGRYSSGRRHKTEENREFANSQRENGSSKKKKNKNQQLDKSPKSDIDLSNRPNPNNRSKFSRDQKMRSFTSSRNGESTKIESEDDIEVDEEEDDDEEVTYTNGIEYSNKKYYRENNEQTENQHYQEEKYNNNNNNNDDDKTSSNSSNSSNSDDESTITIPETGRKVEHIAQKLEQTAQKYAREHSPPKFIERRIEDKNNYENFNSTERRSQSQRRYFENTSKSATLGYERERTLEKNESRHRFERPRPPSIEAPERPNFRERRYSEKEEIYGETYNHNPPMIDKDRGYESNFETKLERTKVLERHYREKESETNENNNNTLKNERKVLLPRQSTAMGHLIQTGRSLEVDGKSPKLVKRTKSFWRFRRDSEVLEGMALWQHRSLVDIPKMLKKETKDEKNQTNESSRKSSYEETISTHRTLEKKNSDSTITNEPKPAERQHVPEKGDFFTDDDFPKPAERPKIVDRTEYVNQQQHHHHHQQHHHRERQQERSYFVGNISRKAILENERKRSLEAKRNMIVAELKENNEAKRNDRRCKKTYGDDDDGLMQNFTETEASDEESTYSCIIVKDQVAEKTLLPRTKLRRDSERERERGRGKEREKNTCGPWYDLWGVDQSVNNNNNNNKKKKKK